MEHEVIPMNLGLLQAQPALRQRVYRKGEGPRMRSAVASSHCAIKAMRRADVGLMLDVSLGVGFKREVAAISASSDDDVLISSSARG